MDIVSGGQYELCLDNNLDSIWEGGSDLRGQAEVLFAKIKAFQIVAETKDEHIAADSIVK